MKEAPSSPFANPALDSTVGPPPPPVSTSTAKTFVLFHSPCPDGAFAALAAWLHFSARGEADDEDKVRFVPHRVYETMEVPSPSSSSTPPPPSPPSSSSPPPTAAAAAAAAAASSSSSPLSSLSASDTVYLLDYSGPAGFPQALARVAKRVVVLDHHKTAAEQLSAVIKGKAWLPREKEEEKKEEEEQEAGTETEQPGGDDGGGDDLLPRNLEVLIDQDRSGAALSAAHFGPPLTAGLARAFAAVQDGDLWRWALPESRAFYAGLHSSGVLDGGGDGEKAATPKTTKTTTTKTTREMLRKLSLLDWEETVRRGAGEVEERDRAVAAEADRAFEVELRGPARAGAGAAAGGGSSSPAAVVASFGRALAVEVQPAQAGLRSLLGNVLAARAKEQKEKGGGGEVTGLRSVGVVAYREPGMLLKSKNPSSSSSSSPSSDEGDHLIKISLRSIGEDEDTTPVSQAHGGGGHRNASSFLMPAKEFASWKV